MSRAHRPVASRRYVRLASISIAALVAVLGTHSASALIAGALYLLPALALALALLCRRYPGERTLHRLRAALASRTSRARRPVSSRALRPRTAKTPRGGRLIAASLAGRAPPLPAAIHCC